MLTIIDRYILKSLVTNYLIALGTMLSLYIVLDMFVNMDEFTEQGYPALTVLGNMVSYYWPNLFVYFKELAGAISLFAGLATLARMRKQNEMTALLASGVSLYRVAAPIVAFGLAATGLLVINTEVMIPAVSHLLARDHDDADGKQAHEVMFLPDRNDALLSAGRFDPVTRNLSRLLVLYRDESGAILSTLEADLAVWEPPNDLHPDGRWRLERGRETTRIRNDDVGLGPREEKVLTFPKFYESDLDPEAIQLRQAESWYQYLSLSDLSALQASGAPNLASIIQTKHARRTKPIISVVMLLLGLPFFLKSTPDLLLNDAGKCLVVCGLCYVTTFIAQSVQSSTASALPAWIPIFIFGTLAVVLIDRIRT